MVDEAAIELCYPQVGMSPLSQVKISPFVHRSHGGVYDGRGFEHERIGAGAVASDPSDAGRSSIAAGCGVASWDWRSSGQAPGAALEAGWGCWPGVSPARAGLEQPLTGGALRERLLGLLGDRYVGFGATLASEKLLEHEGITVSVETIRQLQIGSGLWRAKRRRQKRAFQLRACRPRFGELIQIDGSPHAWLEDRGPRCT